MPSQWKPAFAVVAAVAGLGFDQAALAAEVEEIVVTARRRAEEIQSVPLTIQAYSADELESANITRLQDLANATPGLYIETFNAGQASQVTIRGLSVQNTGGFDPQANNNVGRFIDGVYQTSRNNTDVELLELDRIEIVKGPASALYGRSTFGGSINFVTKPPPDEFEARASVTAGTDEEYQGSAMVGGPLAEGLRGRLSLGLLDFDGTFNNIEDPGENLQGSEQSTANGSLVWDISERFTATLNAFLSDRDEEHSGQYLQTSLNCGTGAFGFTYFCGEPEYRDTVAISPEAFGSKTDAWQTSLRLEYRLEAFTVTGIFAYADNETEALNDADYTAGGALHPVCNTPGCSFNPVAPVTRLQAANAFNRANFENDDRSVELRIQSNGDGPLTWLGGLYWFDSDSEVALRFGVDNTGLAAGESFLGALAFLTSTPDPVNSPVLFSQFESDVQTFALFGSVGYEITDRLTTTVELRWEREDKDFNNILNFFAPGPGETSEDWDFWTPRFTVDYRATDDILVFGSVARGVHSGGFNPSYAPTFPDEAYYDDEDNWTYEIGTKTGWLGGQLIANASVFFVQWDDLQIAGRSQEPAFPASIIRNTGEADDWGIDLQVVAAPAEWVSFGFGYTYSKAEFDSGVFDRGALFACAPDICTITADGAAVGGNQLPRSPENQFTANATFTGSLPADWSWSLRADFNYLDDVYRESINKIEYGGRNLVNLRLAFDHGPWTIALWGRNIFDDEYVTAGAFQPRTFTTRAIDWTQGEGSRAGATVTYRFGGE